MKTKILLFLMTLLFAVMKVNAQTHNMNPGWCKYAKKEKGQAKDESASAECQVCKKENEKERIARAAEDKRRTAEATARGNAKKREEDAAFKKKQAERDEKSKVTEVAVVMPKSSSTVNNISTNSKKQVATQKVVKNQVSGIFMRAMSYGEGFVNAKKTDENIILKDRDSRYKETEGTFFVDGCGIQYGFPANVGIVTLNNEIRVAEPLATELNTSSYYVHDLIDVNEKRTFNSDQISSIEHFYGNWFLIGYNVNKYGYVVYSYAGAKLYNVKTKEYIDIPEKTYRNTINLDIIKFHGLERVVAKNYRYIYGNYQAESNSCHTFSGLSEAEILMQKKLGGEEKWKAFIVVEPISSRSDINFDRYVYYCDQSDKIVKMKITADEARKL